MPGTPQPQLPGRPNLRGKHAQPCESSPPGDFPAGRGLWRPRSLGLNAGSVTPCYAITEVLYSLSTFPSVKQSKLPARNMSQGLSLSHACCHTWSIEGAGLTVASPPKGPGTKETHSLTRLHPCPLGLPYPMSPLLAWVSTAPSCFALRLTHLPLVVPTPMEGETGMLATWQRVI